GSLFIAAPPPPCHRPSPCPPGRRGPHAEAQRGRGKGQSTRPARRAAGTGGLTAKGGGKAQEPAASTPSPPAVGGGWGGGAGGRQGLRHPHPGPPPSKGREKEGRPPSRGREKGGRARCLYSLPPVRGRVGGGGNGMPEGLASPPPQPSPIQ